MLLLQVPWWEGRTVMEAGYGSISQPPLMASLCLHLHPVSHGSTTTQMAGALTSCPFLPLAGHVRDFLPIPGEGQEEGAQGTIPLFVTKIKSSSCHCRQGPRTLWLPGEGCLEQQPNSQQTNIYSAGSPWEPINR